MNTLLLVAALSGWLTQSGHSHPVHAVSGKADPGFVFFDPLDTAAVPKRLSLTGLFGDMGAKTVGTGVRRFDINAALWSDGAVKIRYIALPPDSQITYRDDSAFGFPTGTVLVKNFLIDTIQHDPASRIYLETRLLVKRLPDDSSGTRWYGFSYRWLRDQSDAVLVSSRTGLDTTITTYTSSGQPVPKRWNFPSQSACWRCHMTGAQEVLGFHSAELNRPLAGDPKVNQLRAMADAGVFRGSTFPDFGGLHRWAALTDTTESLEKRARSYLAVNCGFCHGALGRQVIGTVLSATQDFDFFKPDIPINYVNQPGKIDYGIPGSLLMFGGDPEKSIIVHRMRSRPQYQMPPLATVEPDTTALRVLSEWIMTLPAPPMSIAPRKPSPAQVAWIRGGVLQLNSPLPRDARVRLFDMQGGEVPLQSLESGRYRLTAHVSPGMYQVMVPGRLLVLVPNLP